MPQHDADKARADQAFVDALARMVPDVAAHDAAVAQELAEDDALFARRAQREALAAYAHEAWSGWMRYLWSKSILNDDGTLTIPAWAVKRWGRQAMTPYADLPEAEKQSDRAEADKMLAIVEAPDVAG